MRISDWSSDVCSSDLERAQQAAKASEARWHSGAPQGLLDGVPISVKDTLMVAGYPFRRGSRATDEQPVKESAPIVDRARDSGAVVLGITTTPEFGAGPVTISPLTGVTRSEEHTFELQSLMRISYAVFCLNKKK